MYLLIFRQRKDTSTVHKLLLQTSTAVHELEHSLLTANLELANVKTALIFTAYHHKHPSTELENGNGS
jgi:hypothetical protein